MVLLQHYTLPVNSIPKIFKYHNVKYIHIFRRNLDQEKFQRYYSKFKQINSNSDKSIQFASTTRYIHNSHSHNNNTLQILKTLKKESSKNTNINNTSLRNEKSVTKNNNDLTNNLSTFAHSHSHSHSHMDNNPLLILSTKEFRKNPGVRITWIGLLTNVGIAISKFAGGIIFHSQALLADAVHALCDMISDLLTLLSVGLAANKPSQTYPYGYGKIETVGSLAVSTILTTAGFSIGWTSLITIIGPIIPHTIFETLHSLFHIHSHALTETPVVTAASDSIMTANVTNIHASWVAMGSILLKEWIFRATKKIAIQTNSNVLMANAWHHRVDSLTSLVALVTITSGYWLNVACLDAIGGLIVSGMILKAGVAGMSESIKELVDKSMNNHDPRYIEINDLLGVFLNEIPRNSHNNSNRPYSILKLTLLASGPTVRANLILQVPKQLPGNSLTIKDCEKITNYLRDQMRENVPSMRKLNIEYVEEK